MINWMTQIFYRCFFELFKGLRKVIAVRFSKNTSCYIGLSSYDEILIYLKNCMETDI